ncbi:MAG: GHKL domain-containing protein [Eubacterium sp.]
MGPIIDLTTLFPWRIISLLVQTFTCYIVAHSLLKDKYHPTITIGLICIARVITSVLFYNSSEWNAFGYPVFMLLCFIIFIFVTVGSTVSKLLCVVIWTASYLLSSIIMTILCGIVYQGKTYSEIFGTNNLNLDYMYMYLINCIIIVVSGFIFSGLLRIIRAKKIQTNKKNKQLFAYLTFFPVSHIFVVVFALFVAPYNYQNAPDFGSTVNIIVFILMGAIIIFDCFYPFIIDRFEKLTIENEQKEKMLVKNELEYQQTKMLIEEKDEFRKLKHDFSNLLSTTRGFIEIGKPEKALEIINSTQKDIQEISGIPVCSNETVNTVLFIKQQQAEKLNIKFEININETAFLEIDDYSICRIMHNMIDNAINAASQTDKKSINIEIEIKEDNFIIICVNPFKKTYRKNKSENHGYGINIIKEIAKKYKGNYSFTIENDFYKAKTELQNISL